MPWSFRVSLIAAARAPSSANSDYADRSQHPKLSPPYWTSVAKKRPSSRRGLAIRPNRRRFTLLFLLLDLLGLGPIGLVVRLRRHLVVSHRCLL
jgi:hypothetical protein